MSVFEDALKKSKIFTTPDKKEVPVILDPVIPIVSTLSKDMITPHFSWKEALFLPTWNRMANTSDGLNDQVKANLTKVFSVLEEIRTLWGNKPITISCAYRPKAYNALPSIGGAPKSAHIDGMAIDFYISGVKCDEVRKTLIPLLDTFKIRMEHKDGSNWVHIDIRQSTPRYFIP